MNFLAQRFFFLSSHPHLPFHSQIFFPLWWEAQIPKAPWFVAAGCSRESLWRVQVGLFIGEGMSGEVLPQEWLAGRDPYLFFYTLVILSEPVWVSPGSCLQICDYHGFIGFCKFNSQKISSSLMFTCAMACSHPQDSLLTWQWFTLNAGPRTWHDVDREQLGGLHTLRQRWAHTLAKTLRLEQVIYSLSPLGFLVCTWEW